MTLAGKIFTILSFLLTLVFLVFTTPVVKRLIELQKDVQAIEFGGADHNGRTHRAHEEIRLAGVQLDAQRVALQYEINRLRDQVTTEETKAQNQIDVVRSQLSSWKDIDTSEQQSLINWEDVVGDLRKEIEARKQESARLQQDLGKFQKERDERQSQVTALEESLRKAQEKLKAVLESMQKNYEKLATFSDRLEDQVPTGAARS